MKVTLAIILVMIILISCLAIQNAKRIDALDEQMKQQVVLRHVDEDGEKADISMSREREDKLLQAVQDIGYETDVLTQAFKNEH